MLKNLFLTVCLLGIIGCDTSASRRFNVGFETADAKLRELYPSTLTWTKVSAVGSGSGTASAVRAKLEGPMVTIRRDEASDSDRVRVIVREGDESQVTRKTEIGLSGAGPGQCEISVQTSMSNKAVILPDRDKAYEQARMDEIARTLAK